MGKATVAAIAVGLVASLGQVAPGAPEVPGCSGARHLSIDDVSAFEGDTPARAASRFAFKVTSTGCPVPIVLSYEVASVDDASPLDVDTGVGFLWLPAGDMSSRTITAQVTPDNWAEHDEVFVVWLKDPEVHGVVVDKCVGVGTIENDDVGIVFGPKIWARLHCSE
ncbi:hypothetical protein O7635_01525 [Asanoa sp. WMMD1127]|uniref:hypothetical protein n=1 Tax=Asanoa sp. WMMD1127 TaxID=3016107 RepID=UPI002415F61A|nr:hypothetical protein [Asanoa sp. WMMD1127]MDG4820532.1 hypothetical protein [Asanoa sp. WMMD1127]